MKQIFQLSIAMIFAISLLATQGFAFLNITSNAVTQVSRINLTDNVTVLNLTLNLTDDNTSVAVTHITFFFNSTNTDLTGAMSNLSVCIYNSTGLTHACNNTWNGNQILIALGVNSSGVNVSDISNLNLIVVYNTSSSTYYPMNASIFIMSNSSIELDGTPINISNSTFPIRSNWTEVKYVKASANVSPTYVDTNVTNQNFKYYIFSTTGDTFEMINITLPAGYSIENVSFYNITRYNNYKDNITQCIAGNCSVSGQSILINYTPGIENITVYFTANTSASPVINLAFNSTITVTDLLTNSANMSGATNVTTQGLINVTNITIVNNRASASGSDYWEFNLTVNTTTNVSGLVQFKMNNWTSFSKGANIGLVNGNTYYANLRDSSNSTSQNVTNDYQITNGVSLTAVAGTLYNLTLRMIIPSGTVPAADWITSYKILFRSQP